MIIINNIRIDKECLCRLYIASQRFFGGYIEINVFLGLRLNKINKNHYKYKKNVDNDLLQCYTHIRKRQGRLRGSSKASLFIKFISPVF